MENTKKIPTYSELLNQQDMNRPKLSVFHNTVGERKSSIALDHMQNVKLKELQTTGKDIFERVIEREEDQLKAFISNFIKSTKDDFLIRPRKAINSLVSPTSDNSAENLKPSNRLEPSNTMEVLQNNFLDVHSDRSLQQFDNVDDSLSDLADELLKEEMESGTHFIDPKGRFYEAWNKMIFVCSIYIFIMNPVILAFNLELNTFLVAMEILIDLVFMADLVLHFFVAFPDKSGEILVTKLTLVALNYLTGNFFIDLAASFPFSIILLASDYQGVLEGANKWRALMYFKIMRLFRIRTIFDISNVSFLSKMLTKTPFITMASHEMGFKIKRFVKWFLLFIVISHNLSCLWIFTSDFSALNWTSQFEEYSNMDLYIVSLYFNWLSIFSVGYGDITPTNIIELIYTILMLSLGILVYSIFITSLGSILSSQDYKKLKYHKRLDQLRKIKAKFNMKHDLYDKILKHINFDSIMNKYDGFYFIQDLPPKLRTQLVVQMNKEIIMNFKFFRGKPLSFVTTIVVKLKFHRSFKGDEIISEGDIVQDLVFIKEGKLLISLSKKYNNLKVYELRKYEYFGDVLMLANQRSPINLTCSEYYSDLLYLRKDDLETVMDEYPLVYSRISENSTSGYARLLAKIESKIVAAEKRDNKILRKNMEFLSVSKNMVRNAQMERRSTAQDLINRVMKNSSTSEGESHLADASSRRSSICQNCRSSFNFRGNSFIEPNAELINHMTVKQRSFMISRQISDEIQVNEEIRNSPSKFFTKSIKKMSPEAVNDTKDLISRLNTIFSAVD